MFNKNIFIVLVAIIIALANADIGGRRTLVLFDSPNIKTSHSTFISILKEKGYELDFKRVDDESIKLEKYGEFLYDQLIILTQGASDELSISPNDVLNFMDEGKGNVFIATGSAVSDSIRDIASECGINIQDDNTNVYDHFNFDKSDTTHNLIVADQFLKDSPIILQDSKAPILFRGIGHSIRNSPLNYAVLTGDTTAYSGKVSNGQSTKLYGKSVGLVSSLQARNNARLTFTGSLELLSDKFFDSTVETDKLKKVESGNKLFVKNLISWTFQERGILRASALSIVKGNDTKPSLTIKDDISFSVKVEEFVNGKWVPYVDTVQLELIMLDPYIRTFIKGDKNGQYKTDIKLPDVYGVFTFEVTVRRPGYGNMVAIQREPILPFRHDSYERFIPSAYPYYAAAFSMIGGVFVFSIVFLLHKEPKQKAQ